MQKTFLSSPPDLIAVIAVNNINGVGFTVWNERIALIKLYTLQYILTWRYLKPIAYEGCV